MMHNVVKDDAKCSQEWMKTEYQCKMCSKKWKIDYKNNAKRITKWIKTVHQCKM